MTEYTQPIYLFRAFNDYERYAPHFDIKHSIPAVDHFNIGYGQGRPVDIMKYKYLFFECAYVKTEADEKKLRSYDILVAGPGKFIFINDGVMKCLNHLVNRDIQVLPAEIHARNKVIKGYHLIDIINTVHGVDRKRSTYTKFTGYLDKLVPKQVDFMKGHEMAREKEQYGNIYIISTLCEKILKSKKGSKLRGLELCTAVEDEHGIKYVSLE